jgi:hypothetical protein
VGWGKDPASSNHQANFIGRDGKPQARRVFVLFLAKEPPPPPNPLQRGDILQKVSQLPRQFRRIACAVLPYGARAVSWFMLLTVATPV